MHTVCSNKNHNKKDNDANTLFDSNVNIVIGNTELLSLILQYLHGCIEGKYLLKILKIRPSTYVVLIRGESFKYQVHLERKIVIHRKMLFFFFYRSCGFIFSLPL